MKYIGEIAKLVNSGSCWAIVGAGASCELGVPSWPELARGVYEHISDQVDGIDKHAYESYLANGELPKLFSLAESDLGGIEDLCKLVASKLVAKRRDGELYRQIAEWPFAGYLTTNYDTLLKEHLDRTGTAFTVLGNTAREFAKLRADARGVVVHIHGTTADPDNIVLTSKQYAEFRSSSNREYFRKKLESFFTMLNIVILGYSLSDPDIQLILETAKELACPDHPVYMIASGMSQADVQELYETRNVRVVTYDNPDGTHSNLSRGLLPAAGRFIASRERGRSPLREEPVGLEESAASLYVYSRGQLMDPSADAVENSLSALALRTLSRLDGQRASSEEQLVSSLPVPALSDENRHRIGPILARLEESRLVRTLGGGVISLTESGLGKVEEGEAAAVMLRDQVEEQIRLDFRKQFPDCDDKCQDVFSRAAIQGIDGALRRRGLAIAASSIGGQAGILRRDVDVLEYLRDASNELEAFEHRSFFIQYLADSLANPSNVFRQYLARQSQGYFAFHTLGLHSGAAQLRRDWLDSTVWILDSSVILPFLARESSENSFTQDLFNRIRSLGIAAYTTESLFEEVIEHARWAVNTVRQYGVDTKEFMTLALVRGESTQNLFVNGFIRSAADLPALGFGAYMKTAFGVDDLEDLHEGTKRLLRENNVQSVKFSEWNGFRSVDWSERPYWTAKIREDRLERGRYKNDDQCEAEAEVLILIRGERDGTLGVRNPGEPSRAYFVTRSGVLRRVCQDADCLVWSPEALYRYLLLFPGELSWNDDAVFELIRSDVYLSGVSVIDEKAYARFFNPRIHESNLRMKEAAEEFGEGEAEYLQRYSRFYDDQVAELEKPAFSEQVAWDIARREKARADRAAVVPPLSDKDRRDLERYRLEEKFRRQKSAHKRRSKEQEKLLGNKKQRRRRKLKKP